jgi:ABC-type Zn2+ transport system substrate-binding protein/surface adhesin
VSHTHRQKVSTKWTDCRKASVCFGWAGKQNQREAKRTTGTHKTSNTTNKQHNKQHNTTNKQHKHKHKHKHMCAALWFLWWLLPTCDTLVKCASQGSHVGGIPASRDDPPAAQK